MEQQERRRLLGSKLPDDLGDDVTRLHTLAEVAFLAAAADGEISDAEINLLVSNLNAWLGEELDDGTLLKLFEHLASQLASEGMAARLAACAGALDADGRRIAYTLACVTTLCDLEVHDSELGFLGTVADALGIPSDEAQATFDELDEVVTSMAAS